MQDPTFVQRAFAAIAPRYVLANHILSLGIDVRWRRHVARRAAALHPARVLDVASGSGDLADAVQTTCPAALVVGADFCAPMLRHARRRGLPHLVVADGLSLPFADGTFDLLTVGFGLRNMADYAAASREFARVLRPSGSLMVLDFSLPRAALLRGPYRFYLHRVLPLLGGLVTGERAAYTYLGGTIETFPSGNAMTELLTANGFVTADATLFSGGIASLYVATTPALPNAGS